MPTTAKELDSRLIFQKRAAASSDYGATDGDWADQFSCWAKIYIRAGRGLGSEAVVNQRQNAEIPAALTVRYNSQTRKIEPSWRAVHMRGDGIIDYYAIKGKPARLAGDYGFLTMEASGGAADGGNGR